MSTSQMSFGGCLMRSQNHYHRHCCHNDYLRHHYNKIRVPRRPKANMLKALVMTHSKLFALTSTTSLLPLMFFIVMISPTSSDADLGDKNFAQLSHHDHFIAISASIDDHRVSAESSSSSILVHDDPDADAAGGSGNNNNNYKRPDQFVHEFKTDPNEADQSSNDYSYNHQHHHQSHHHNQEEEKQRSQQHDADYYYPESNNSGTSNNHSNHDLSASSDISLMSNSFVEPKLNRLPDKEYLSHHIADKACRLDRGCQRKDRLNNTYLSYCSRYKLENLLSNEILMSIMHDSSDECDKILDEFIQLDELINQFDRLFKNLLTRYNCHNGYSVKWSCDDCKKAYKDWLCATNLPYYMNGERIKPCISFCERVEQRCPYFHPITKEQYGGQPVFICRDPNIPFVPEITPDIPYSEPSKCYDLCHLSDNLTELIIDSLSKYDYDKCPDKSSIAEEVRSDPLYCNLESQQQQQQSLQSNKSTTATTPSEPNHSVTTEYSGEETIINSMNEIPNTPQFTSKPSKPTTVIYVHLKKLYELREVLTIYKSQPKTHGFVHHSEHSSALETSKTHDDTTLWLQPAND